MTIAKQVTSLPFLLPAVRAGAKPAGIQPEGGFSQAMSRQAQNHASDRLRENTGGDEPSEPVRNSLVTEEEDGTDFTTEGTSPFLPAPPASPSKGPEVTARKAEGIPGESGQQIAVLAPAETPGTPPGPDRTVLVRATAPTPGTSAPATDATLTLPGQTIRPALAADTNATDAEVLAGISENQRGPGKAGTAERKAAPPTDLVARLRLQVAQTSVPTPKAPPIPVVPPIKPAEMAGSADFETQTLENPNPARVVEVATASPDFMRALAEDARPALPIQVAPRPPGDTALGDGVGPKVPATAPQQPSGIGELLAGMGRSGQSGPIEIALSPEELGRVRLHMVPSGDTMRVTIMIERPETMDLFRRGAEGFLNDLRQAGFSGATLDFSAWDNGTPSRPPSQPTASDEGAPVAAAPERPRAHRAAISGTGLYLRL